MPNQTKAPKEIPYHLRAPRLRWAVFAVTLEPDELARVEAVADSATASPQAQLMAQVMLRLHHREDLAKLCTDLHLTRRKLLELADRLTTQEERRKLLAQPAPKRGPVKL